MKTTMIRTLIATLSILTAAHAAVIQNGVDIIAFEAEIGIIDNSYDDPAEGWISQRNSGASGGFGIVSTENDGSPVGLPPNNTALYQIEFDKTGTYDLWFRLKFTTEDFEQSQDDRGNNDSFYIENGTIGSAGTFLEANSIGVNSLNWLWFNLTTATVASPGLTDWYIGNREDGLQIDRIVFQHTDDASGPADWRFNSQGGGFDGVVPEPTTALYGFLGIVFLGGYRANRIRRVFAWGVPTRDA